MADLTQEIRDEQRETIAAVELLWMCMPEKTFSQVINTIVFDFWEKNPTIPFNDMDNAAIRRTAFHLATESTT